MLVGVGVETGSGTLVRSRVGFGGWGLDGVGGVGCDGVSK